MSALSCVLVFVIVSGFPCNPRLPCENPPRTWSRCRRRRMLRAYAVRHLALCSRPSLTLINAAMEARADAFVRSWVSGVKLGPDAYPESPVSVADLYATHLAIAKHPLVESELGGIGGYKIGAPGGAGEVAISAPLFKRFLVEAPGRGLSASFIGLCQIEPEIGVVMGADLPPRDRPYSVEDAWAAVDSVVLIIECCGQRSTPEAAEAVTSALGKYADTLSSGGIVLGPRLPAAQVGIEGVKCAVELFVNDEKVATGSGKAAPQGGPAESLAWVVNHLNSRPGGLYLKAGELVATGQMCNTKLIKPGDRVRAEYAQLGEVEMVVEP